MYFYSFFNNSFDRYLLVDIFDNFDLFDNLDRNIADNFLINILDNIFLDRHFFGDLNYYLLGYLNLYDFLDDYLFDYFYLFYSLNWYIYLDI